MGSTTSTSRTRYDSKGNPIETTTTSNSSTPDPKHVKPTAATYGFNRLFASWLKGEGKEIGAILKKAIKEEWTPERFQQAVAGTKWAQKRTAAQERFDLGVIGDKATWQKNMADQQKAIKTQAAKWGVTLSDKVAADMAHRATRNAFTADDIDLMLADQVRVGETPLQGEASVAVDDLRAMANKYGMKVSDKVLTSQVQTLLRTGAGVDTMEDYYREQAKTMFPSVAKDLDRGLTVEDVLQPYVSTAASLLDLNPADLDYTDEKWKKALSFTGDKGTDEQRRMSSGEWERTLRTDPTYGYDRTTTAMSEARSFAGSLMSAFGIGGAQ